MKYVLILCGIIWGSVSAQAFDVQYVDCSTPDSMDKVIINIYPDAKTGTIFFSADVENDINSGVLRLNRDDTETAIDSEFVTFTAENGMSVFVVGFPRALIHKPSDRLVVQVSARLKDGSAGVGGEMICFSRLY